MNNLIEFAKDQCEIFPEDSDMGLFLREVIKILEVKSIPLDRVVQARGEIYNLVDLHSRSSKTKVEAKFNTRALKILDKLIESGREETESEG